MDSIWTFGNVLNMAGLLVSLIGFGVTIVTVKKAGRRAQEAAQRAVDRVAERLAFGLIRNALHLAQEMRQQIHAHLWDRVVDRSEQLAIALVTLSENKQLSLSESSEMAGLIDDVDLIKKQVEKVPTKGPGATLASQPRDALDKIIRALSKMESRRQNPTLETIHG
jgi:hypothetical protein